jgi:hypothetical protein
MAAYLLMVLAVLSRVVPFPGMNFTAVGAGLLYFGARRPLREMALPVLALMATDYYLTAFAYHYPWHMSAYLISWAWYAAVVVLGRIMLSQRITVTRVVGAPVLASTSFFAISNYAFVGGLAYVSTHGGRVGRVLCCGAAVLPERFGVDDGDYCSGVWRAGAGAEDGGESGAEDCCLIFWGMTEAATFGWPFLFWAMASGRGDPRPALGAGFRGGLGL